MQAKQSSFIGESWSGLLVTIDSVAAVPLLVDGREAERYSGKVRPLNPIAVHIPRAISHSWKENLAGNGHFLDSGQ